MSSTEKVAALVRLGQYLTSEDPALETVKERAFQANGWFTPEFINLALRQISDNFLEAAHLNSWINAYPELIHGKPARTVGIVTAGNIPLVGFHDWLCGFVSGHNVRLKLSSKDVILMQHVLDKMKEWHPEWAEQTTVQDMLKNCDAYIATGSNNSSRYFQYYFAQYPHIIRRNRTSVAILTGEETPAELEGLADDISIYFGLGCRNVTKVYVPGGYDFSPLLEALRKYSYFADHHKYKNNYDYNLALILLNNSPFMTNESILLQEATPMFSPLSMLNYGYYTDKDALVAELQGNEDLQCLVGKGFTPFGMAQQPSLTDYADGVDTLDFLSKL
ncbi:acyl-CoA reductase [Chitinophaga sancti]|uniref:Acyl-CoA reductase n=1 Tax=Chitinophaga sancti TaxID=1004 RepID=A0A1K1RTT8_9BACT|nr:acyl-CoA reductase [Chitinophaga sancti]WQD62390.1 acyl-CoA reductase [Chitinophaga sancti]WQG92041.1 acyl-CoA reductase [Chitinophaga sancti]SFW75473.1 Acyl-CoA reductase (LuxC) [Chitinophaga sancti]